MKIIATDNHNRESVADYLVCENVNEVYGTMFVQLLNDQPNEVRWYRLVPDTHKLWRGMEELV